MLESLRSLFSSKPKQIGGPTQKCDLCMQEVPAQHHAAHVKNHLWVAERREIPGAEGYRHTDVSRRTTVYHATLCKEDLLAVAKATDLSLSLGNMYSTSMTASLRYWSAVHAMLRAAHDPAATLQFIACSTHSMMGSEWGQVVNAQVIIVEEPVPTS